MSARTNQLLAAMADKHCNLDFIDGNFLDEHNVGSNELQVFELAGNILKGYLRLPQSQQVAIQLLGAGIEPALAENMRQGLRLGEVHEEMSKIKL